MRVWRRHGPVQAWPRHPPWNTTEAGATGERPVWLATGAYLCTAGAFYDVHNDYAVQDIQVDLATSSLHLDLVRRDEDWVTQGTPRALRFSLCALRDVMISGRTGGPGQENIMDIAYTGWEDPVMDRGVLMGESPEADALAIDFEDGSYLRARADDWRLEVIG